MSVLLSGLIKNKSLCETIPSPNEIAKQVGGGGEEELSTKSPVLRLGFYFVVNVSVVAVIAQSSAHHPRPPPPKKKRNWQNCCFVSLKMFVKSAQNRSLSSEICPEKSHEV